MYLNNVNKLFKQYYKNNDYYISFSLMNLQCGYFTLFINNYISKSYKNIKLTEKEVIYLCKINKDFKQMFLNNFKLIVKEYNIKDDSYYSLFRDCCVLSIYNKAINKIDTENEQEKTEFGLSLLRRYSRINIIIRITKEIEKSDAKHLLNLFNSLI